MYRTICTHLWTDRKVQRLTRDGKLLFVYLITNPHSHMCGIYYLPEELIKKEVGLSDTLCHTLWDTLSSPDLNLAHYDPETSTVFIVNMFGYQGKGEKNEKCAAKHLDTLHDSLLIDRFLLRYPTVKPFCSDTLSYTLCHRDTDPSKRCPSVPDPVLLISSPSSPELNPKILSNGHAEEFEQFWLSYPRKVGKKAAQRAWLKAKDRPDIVQVIRRLEESKRSEQWRKESGQFIPHPSTWINEGRWDDEPTPKPPSTMEAFLSRGRKDDKTRIH